MSFSQHQYTLSLSMQQPFYVSWFYQHMEFVFYVYSLLHAYSSWFWPFSKNYIIRNYGYEIIAAPYIMILYVGRFTTKWRFHMRIQHSIFIIYSKLFREQYSIWNMGYKSTSNIKLNGYSNTFTSHTYIQRWNINTVFEKNKHFGLYDVILYNLKL